ncbi:hypothetical protein AJ79_03782 [Helicocarpus griseus UAMH5409]|uniref:Transcription factor domain-containing protein n=1 Tax=Helicocarpus griseus UAMH5409 TaxID=1447875 RepID=A0A2B7XN72_9EURO|nr:hypothetical protein AJ79_03782 [Helicocarpus griseus UAMH5409]
MLEQLDQQAEEIQRSEARCNGPFQVFRCGTSIAASTTISNPSRKTLAILTYGNQYCRTGRMGRIVTTVSRQPGLQDSVYRTIQHQRKLAYVKIASHMPGRNPRQQKFDGDCVHPAPVQSKSPWEILYAPNVLSTLLEISLTGDSSNAKVSHLFAVFAISAFSLDILQAAGGESVASDWGTLGRLYRERATKRLQLSVRDLSTTHKKTEKYKTILMPLLSMVIISVVSGEMGNAAHYLHDIEQVITLYGLTKARQSRKVKILHSIYLYLRVLTEGTILPDRNSSDKPMGRPQTDSDPESYRRLWTWDKLLQEPARTNDILNLDFMQSLVAPKSTFEQIYSIPASLFKLILETTHLAGQIERFRICHHRRMHTNHDEYAANVKKLESSICEWEYPGRPSCDNRQLPLGDNFPYHLVHAIYSALVIYFYRCVRDVNAMNDPTTTDLIYAGLGLSQAARQRALNLVNKSLIG